MKTPRLLLSLLILQTAAAPAWPAVARTMVRPAPSLSFRPAPTLRASALPTLTPALPAPVLRAVVAPAPAPVPAVAVMPALQQTVEVLQAQPAQAEAALGTFFENAAKPSDTTYAFGETGASRSSLSPSQPGAPRGPTQGPSEPRSEKPKSSISRILKVGTIGAVVPMILTAVTMIGAAAFGYTPTPNYENPAAGVTTLLQASLFTVMAAFMAPVAEEIVFRAGAMRLARKLFGAAAFWAPAVVTSALFVVIHETADPVLMATRFVDAMIITYIYHKEGLPAAMAAHGIFNGMLAAPLLLSAIFGATAGGLLGMAVLPAMTYLAWRFWKQLKTQPEVERPTLTSSQANTLAAALLAGFLLLAPNIIWLAAALGVFGYRWFGSKAKKA